ncbi:MAG: ferritin-like domain-containing protein [Actinomycetota bacterium]|nr:ferritin-like domain-containing protein [Actinomycetota bacterium]
MSREIGKQLVKYLGDAHAMEEQSVKLLEKAEKLAGELDLAQLFHGHLNDTRDHERYVKQRLEDLGESSSAMKDGTQKGAAIALGALVQAMPDTPAKLAAVAFAFESFEIASYTMLRAVAQRADDEETIAMCDRIIPVEQQAAELIAQQFETAVEASLEKVGVQSP